MKYTVEEMNISHVTTSYYHHQGNFKIDQLHQTLHNVMSKKVSDSLDSWHVYLNQVLANTRFNINESTKFSLFYLLYNHNSVSPIDNIMKPRRRYSEEEPHRIGLEQQHRSFVMVHQHLKKGLVEDKARYADNNSQYTEFQVGDPVYLKQQQCKSKLQCRWCPSYRIIEKMTPAQSVMRSS